MFGRYGETSARIIERQTPAASFDGYAVLPSLEVETYLLAHAGARPWNRGSDEIRVLSFIAEGRGDIIDDEREVGGYPHLDSTRAPFRVSDWDLSTMKPRNGKYPGQAIDAQEVLSPRDKAMRKGT